MRVVKAEEASGSLDNVRANLAASFQSAVVDALVGRTLKAAKLVGAERIVVAGGVGANRHLRSRLVDGFAGTVHFPPLAYCTDNGAMIAVAGALRLAEGKEAGEILSRARWSLESLEPPATAVAR